MRFSNQINFLFKLKHLFYFALLGLFILWQVVLPFLGQQNNGHISKVLGCILSLSLVFSAITTFINTNKLTKYGKYFFWLTSIIWIAITFVLYPGIYSLDLANVLIPAANNLTGSWGSHIYSAMLMVLYPLLPNLFAVNLFSVFLLLALIFRLARNFPPETWFKTAFFILIFNLPVLHLFLNFSYRDVVASLISALLIEILFRVYKNRELSIYEFAEIGAFTTICFLIKADHFHYVLFVPLAVWFYDSRNTHKSKILYALTIILLPLVIGLFYQIQRIEMKDGYKISALWNPLNEIVYKRNAQIADSDKQVIAKIINYDYLKNNHDPYEIDGFHRQEFKFDFPKEDFTQLLKVYVSLVFRHWDIFLENRVKLFLRANELDGQSYLYQDQINQWNEHVNKHIAGLEIAYPTLNTNIKNDYFAFIEKYIRSNQVFAAVLSGTGLLIFLFFMSMFLVYPNILGFIILDLVIFRFLWVFLLAPAFHLKYHGYLLFPTLAIFVCSVSLFDWRFKTSKPARKA